jgi:hypothetical protein
MKILIPGHRYELNNHEPTATVPEAPYPGSVADDVYKLALLVEELPASEKNTAISIAVADIQSRLLYKEQTLQFIQKEASGPNSKVGPFVTIHNGTTNEEVLRVLIDRLDAMNNKLPCKENAVALTHIQTGLLWLEKRTAERKARNVEGTPKP